jgi:hypothetical protein
MQVSQVIESGTLPKEHQNLSSAGVAVRRAAAEAGSALSETRCRQFAKREQAKSKLLVPAPGPKLCLIRSWQDAEHGMEPARHGIASWKTSSARLELMVE